MDCAVALPFDFEAFQRWPVPGFVLPSSRVRAKSQTMVAQNRAAVSSEMPLASLALPLRLDGKGGARCPGVPRMRGDRPSIYSRFLGQIEVPPHARG